ncbi:MAG: family peptidase [Sphingomonadales bacterium]|nr:family peptidase [Sphingomonadales bacterium]
MVAPGPGQSTELYTVDTSGGGTPARILVASGKPDRLSGCGWVGNNRLACQVFGLSGYAGQIYGFSTVVALDADGANRKLLSQRRGENAQYMDLRGGGIIDYLPDQSGSVLMIRSYVPEGKIGTIVAKTAEGMGVDRIDTLSGGASRVETPQRDAVEYITDGHGTVRVIGVNRTSGTGYDKGSTRYLYRAPHSRDWLPLSVYDHSSRLGFNPYAVDAAKNVVYGFERVDGRQALLTYSLDEAKTRDVVYARSDVDIDGLMQVGRAQRVVGLSYATDKRQTIYFDPAIKALTASLAKALGGNRLVQIVDMSADENKVLVWGGSDVDPGQYYLFDRATKKLSPIIPARPLLAGVKLAQVQSVSYRAADGTMIPAYLTLPVGKDPKNLPAIVIPHGGPSARDEWGFDWLAQYFVARGFAVLQPNFRGSSGYGNAWFEKNGFQSWRVAIGDVDDAGKWLVTKGIADPARLTILGWSYGGYAALQSAVTEPGLFKAVVAIAPVTDLGSLARTSEGRSNYYEKLEFIGHGPHLIEGSPAQNAGKIKVPVLIFHGTVDANVDITQSRLMASKMKSAGVAGKLVVFDGLDHQLEDSSARAAMLQKAGDFLAAVGK